MVAKFKWVTRVRVVRKFGVLRFVWVSELFSGESQLVPSVRRDPHSITSKVDGILFAHERP
jgi:hypothetical protein